MDGWKGLLAAGAFAAAGVLACAQTPEAQPAPLPQPAQAPLTPMAPVAPLPPMAPDMRPEVREQIEEARAMAQDQAAQARELAEEAREQAREQTRGLDEQLREHARALADMARQQSRIDLKDLHVDFAQNWAKSFGGRSDSEDGLYDSGQRALDGQRYDEALNDFKEVAARAGNHTEGALYWEAYTLNKMARPAPPSPPCARITPTAVGWKMPKRWRWR
jgi:vacuolar-type H+-ATPase subunit H